MRLADTHCHLNLDQFQDDLDQVLTRAWGAGVDRILIPGTTIETSQKAVELADRHENLFAAVGVHPNESLTWNEESEQQLSELARHPKVVAVGEIGLDYYRDYAPQPLQQDVLQSQLNFATKADLPVIIHSRQSLSDLLPILVKWQTALAQNGSPLAGRPGVLHSYEGDRASAQQAIDHHFMIGVTGPVTFQNAEERQSLVQKLPLRSMLIETDAPYLTPHPHRGRRNEPAFVLLVAEKIAAIHRLAVVDIARMTSDNAERLFSWRTSA